MIKDLCTQCQRSCDGYMQIRNYFTHFIIYLLYCLHAVALLNKVQHDKLWHTGGFVHNNGISNVLAMEIPQSYFNTLRLRQNGRHFTGDIFKCIFLKENVWIPIKISLKFVPKGPINNIPALVQIMAWRRPGDKPLYEPMMVCLLTHICVTRPQWVKSSIWQNAKMITHKWHLISYALVWVMGYILWVLSDTIITQSVNSPNPCNRCPIAHTWVLDMGYLICFQNLIYVLLLSLQCCM